eukprot:jgi/Ulvmu1/11530/UM078_0019.1
MAPLLLNAGGILLLFATVGAGSAPSTANLCEGPAIPVSQLSHHQTEPAGQVLIQGTYLETQWADRFIVEDDRNDARITVLSLPNVAFSHLRTGDSVRVRGSILGESEAVHGFAIALQPGEDGVAVCPDMQLTSISTRRLAQSSGKSRRRRTSKKRVTKKTSSKKKTSTKKSSKKTSTKKKSSKKKSSTKKSTSKKKSSSKKRSKKKSTKTKSSKKSSKKSKTSSKGNVWKSIKNLPISMGEVSSGVLKSGSTSYLVVVGQHPNGDSKDGATMIFDISKQIWYEASSRPEVGNHHASEVIGNKMYLFGGLSDGEGDVQIGTLKNTRAGIDISWKKGAGLPFDGGSAATAVIGGKVYYCGGINKSNTKTVNTCAIYDPKTNKWTSDSKKAPSMPKGRNHAASCTDGKKMFVFGGRSGKNVVGDGFADTQILDPGKGWTSGKALPLARGGMGKAVYHNGKCYVFGGEVSTDVMVSESAKIESTRTVYRVDVYDISKNSWSQAKDMPKGLHGMFPVKHNGKVYVAAGGTEAAYSQSKLHYVYTL